MTSIGNNEAKVDMLTDVGNVSNFLPAKEYIDFSLLFPSITIKEGIRRICSGYFRLIILVLTIFCHLI